MNRISRSSVTVGLLVGLSMAGGLYLSGCMFPTVEDVNRMADAERSFVSGEHEKIVEAFTAQHVLQTPELAPELQVVIEQYNLAVAELRTLADEVKAEGLDATELVALVAASVPGLGGLVWLSREKTKPSRSADKVAKLESEAAVGKEKLTALLHDLATAAGAKEAIPTPT